MSLLVDLFGYLSIIIHGLTIVAQSMALGSVFFLVFLARPLGAMLASAGPAIQRDVARIGAWSAAALIACEAATIALEVSVLVGTIDLPVSNAMGANFALAGMVKIAAALVLAVALFRAGPRANPALLLGGAAVVLIAATLTTHAAARLDDRGLLLLVACLHQLGAAIWIGGIPAFISALARVRDAADWRIIGARFSRMSMLGVACILLSGITMSLHYIGAWDAFYGTAYGVMVLAKIAMFLMLLGLGFLNFRTVERLRWDPATPVIRMRRFAEVELAIGFSIFFAAASLTSVPPAVDLTEDRVSWHEIVERFRPEPPRLASPDYDTLALPALQNRLDAEAAQRAAKPAPAFVPGSGELPDRNAADIAWSEYNHHWSGILVLSIGLLALLNQAGLRWARHWPLLFLLLAVFLFFRSDPEVWPLGKISFADSMRDIEVVQHRFFVVLIVVFGLFEWRVRAGGWRSRWAALVFPIITAGGGAALLTHSHAIANVKEALLIELSHTPLALTAIIAGCARWLEIRLDGRASRIAGWIWPVCFLLIGLLLLSYREA